jgi:hypothetical protein
MQALRIIILIIRLACLLVLFSLLISFSPSLISKVKFLAGSRFSLRLRRGLAALTASTVRSFSGQRTETDVEQPVRRLCEMKAAVLDLSDQRAQGEATQQGRRFSRQHLDLCVAQRTPEKAADPRVAAYRQPYGLDLDL